MYMQQTQKEVDILVKAIADNGLLYYVHTSFAGTERFTLSNNTPVAPQHSLIK